MPPDRDSPVSVAYFVVSFGTASWPFLTVVSTFTPTKRLATPRPQTRARRAAVR